MSVAHWASAGAAGVLFVSGCALPGSPKPGVPSQAGPEDLVVVGTAGTVTALDWATSRQVYQASNAVATPDWSRLVVGSPNGDGRKLAVLDGQTGAREGVVDVPGGLTAMALSTDGGRVALAPTGATTEAGQPAGREQTRIVVADVSGVAEPRTFDLTGNYEPDAFSSDNQRLFLLEYQPARAPDRYYVKQLDLKTGAVQPVGSRSKEAVPAENMRGTRRMHVLSPDHETLYTLYTHQPDHLHSRDLVAGLTAASGDVHAFVHVLSLSESWAYCLDLPQPFGIGPADAHSLALSPDGNALYVSDLFSGTVARVNTTALIVRATADVGADPNPGSGLVSTSQVGPDGSLFLSGSSEIRVIEPNDLGVSRRLPVADATGGLGMSADGRRLFVTTRDSVLAIDPLTGTQLGRIRAPGQSQRIEHVGTPAAAR